MPFDSSNVNHQIVLFSIASLLAMAIGLGLTWWQARECTDDLCPESHAVVVRGMSGLPECLCAPKDSP